jgi:hypothetical protein
MNDYQSELKLRGFQSVQTRAVGLLEKSIQKSFQGTSLVEDFSNV